MIRVGMTVCTLFTCSEWWKALCLIGYILAGWKKMGNSIFVRFAESPREGKCVFVYITTNTTSSLPYFSSLHLLVGPFPVNPFLLLPPGPSSSVSPLNPPSSMSSTLNVVLRVKWRLCVFAIRMSAFASNMMVCATLTGSNTFYTWHWRWAFIWTGITDERTQHTLLKYAETLMTGPADLRGMVSSWLRWALLSTLWRVLFACKTTN